MRNAVLALFALAVSCTSHQHATVPPDLPRGSVWVEHLQKDLAPFWTSADAVGTPEGNFPTFRCHDGRRFDPAAPCDELAKAGSWISENLDRDYVRMKSRQTYFYGVAYHLTGDPRMLELARAGAAWIVTHALDRKAGGSASYFINGVPDTPPSMRTTQDLAYAQLGLAMVYYLTRDPNLLEEIVALKRHIFHTYDDGSGLLLWVTDDPDGDDEKRRELVSQLDQINAYMLLLAPIVPEPHRTEWKNDLERLADGMVTQYWEPEYGMFRGTIHDRREPFYGSRHADFGHSIKALWMIERVGRLVGRRDLVEFATSNVRSLLARAWMPEVGCWGSGYRSDGSLDRSLTWWTFAELDQMTATLALSDPEAASNLPASSRCWFEKMVDREHGEVWGSVDRDRPERHFAKAHLWKNGYHSAEHALVSYITAQQLHGEPAALWFAFDPESVPFDSLRPYFFDGRVTRKERGVAGTKVSFTRVR